MFLEKVADPILLMKSALAAVMMVCIFFITFGLGPSIETKYFPVVGKLVIVDPAPDEEGSTVLTAEFRKLRDCEYIGITWSRMRSDGSLERVPISLRRSRNDDSSPNRPLGTTIAGPWVVGMPLDQIRGSSFVEVFHKCHVAWTTRTQFYP